MKIVAIDVYQVDLPYSGGTYVLSGGREYQSFDATIVRVTTQCGIQGFGESTPFGPNYIAAHALGVRAGINEIAPQLLGKDPRLCDRLNDTMNQALLGHLHAKAPLDVACWDIFGKSVDLPVCQLLGGSTGERLPVISSIYAGTPDDMRARVHAHREQGYLGHSVKIGASELEGGPKLDTERVKAALADAVAGEYFIVDANGGLSVEHAMRVLKLLPANLDFVLEAPCSSYSEHQRLHQIAAVPLIVDELATDDVSIARIIADRSAEGIGLKISKAGGLTQGKRQRDMCIAAGLTMSVQDTVGSEIAFAGVLHLGQTVPNKNLRCVLDTRDMVSLCTAELDAPMQQGGVIAPDTPGLGVIPNMSVLGDPVAHFS
ncbi:MAG: L-alanine-DL-glutamate epimerase-like enolase superfamily enzyme [Saprospiraceae bacterium]|jgi:L-alanine-DL-glutamate epimerase-like enolase superfamily enzyme